MRFFRRRTRYVKAPARQWFQAEDGTFYRNCPLIVSEREQVRAWPAGTFLKWQIVEELSDEWWRTFRQGVQRKASLDSRDVVVTPASFREAYPGHPGLWKLDEPEVSHG